MNKAKQPPACVLVEWNLQKDIGMTCGGVAHFLFEIFQFASWPIAVFGAGHVSQALTRLLASLNCSVQVYDTRPELLAKILLAPNIRPQQVEPLESAVDLIPEGAFVVVMTQGHRTDKPILERILKTRRFPYLGVIGSASKAAVLRRELRESGIAHDLVQNAFPVRSDCRWAAIRRKRSPSASRRKCCRSAEPKRAAGCQGVRVPFPKS